jgi:hypothetical protein
LGDVWRLPFRRESCFGRASVKEVLTPAMSAMREEENVMKRSACRVTVI